MTFIKSYRKLLRLTTGSLIADKLLQLLEVEVGVKGVSLNPVTAVAYRQGKGIFASNKRGTLQAGKALGLTRTFTNNLYQATTNYSNRGHSQVVRGKIRSALGV